MQLVAATTRAHGGMSVLNPQETTANYQQRFKMAILILGTAKDFLSRNRQGFLYLE